MKKQIPDHITTTVDTLIRPFGLSLKELLSQQTDIDKNAKKKWLTVTEAEEYSALSRWTLGRLVKSSKICQAKLGESKSSKVLINKKSLDLYLTSRVLLGGEE